MDNPASLESRLLQNGCVVLYHNPYLLESYVKVLEEQGWKYKEISIARSGTVEEFYEQVALALNFPAYFGKNLDAFRDCLGDISFPENGRLALGLIRFDLVAKHDARFAHIVLDICAEAERGWLMEGKRILFLVQSKNPDLQFPPIGATAALWNFEEWLDAKRKGRT